MKLNADGKQRCMNCGNVLKSILIPSLYVYKYPFCDKQCFQEWEKDYLNSIENKEDSE